MKRFVLLIAILLFSSFAAAQTAEEILNRWAEATGGREKIASLKNIYVKSTVSMGGLSGEVEDWNTPFGNHKSMITLGEAFRNVTVYNASKKNGWIKDDNGKVRELDGSEFESEVTTAYLGSYSMFFTDRMKGDVEFAGEDQGKQYFILKISPRNGRLVTIYLDRKTYLPARQEQQEGDRLLTIHFSGYRPIDGIQLASEFRQTTGDPKYDLTGKLEEAKFNVPVNVSFFLKPTENPPDFRFASGKQATGIPFELTSNHIYVQVSVNHSKPLWFLLDSGAAYAVLNEARAKELGLELKGKLEGRGAGEKSTDVSLLSDVTYALKGVEVLHQHAATIDLEPLEAYEGRKMDGIIGYDFISRFVVEIDYGNGVINLYDPASYRYTGSWYSVPIELEGNTPVVKAAVEVPRAGALEGRFTIDTGSRLPLTLNKPFHESHQLVSAVGKTIEAPMGFGVGGQTKQKVGRIANIQIGGAVLKNVLTSFSLDAKGADADPDITGNIGGEILRRFKVILDYSKKRMILEPNSHYEEPFEYDASGMAIGCSNSDLRSFKVINVIADSPAGEAGIQVGDVLKKIDGRDSSEFTLDELRKIFRSQNETHEITTNRGTVTFKTRALI